MKIVQSLWSKPAQASGGWEKYAAGWPNPRFLWCSWALSMLWALKHYGQVELVTDDDGARWLVDKLKLPFTAVRTDLQSVDVPPLLWAYGKIVAYSLQTEPFFHIDGDVYLMGKLPEKYEKAELLCQFFEQYPAFFYFEPVYDKNREVIEKVFPRLPSFWRFMSERSAGNCGIMGGTNIDAIQKYTSDVRELVTHPDNQSHWPTAPVDSFVSCVIEQQTLWCSAREQGIKLTPIFENTDFASEDALRHKALTTNFNHAAGSAGKNPFFGRHLAMRVQAEFPDHFAIIERLFPMEKTESVPPNIIKSHVDARKGGGKIKLRRNKRKK